MQMSIAFKNQRRPLKKDKGHHPLATAFARIYSVQLEKSKRNRQLRIVSKGLESYYFDTKHIIL